MLREKIDSCRKKAKAVVQADDAQIEHGLELHRQSFVCDCFAFCPRLYGRKEMEHINEVIREGGSSEEVQEAREDASALSIVNSAGLRETFGDILEAAGVDCLVTTVGVGPRMRRGLRHVGRFTYLCDSLGGIIGKAVTAGAARRTYESGGRCFVFSANSTPAMGPFEDGYDMLRWLETYYLMGIRMMHLTYNRRNWIGDGCTEPTNAGLSAFGREVVGRLNDLGIIVDVPHSGKQTTLDAAKTSRAPIMASHTGCEAVFGHPRCKSDEEIKAIAETGGAIGIYALPGLLGNASEANLRTLLEHVDHAVRLVGPDHVLIGTDSTCSLPPPEDIEVLPGPPSRTKWWSLWGPNDLQGDPNDETGSGSLAWINWPWYTVGLVTLGYDDDTIRKIIGQNFLRILDQVQSGATPRFRLDA